MFSNQACRKLAGIAASTARRAKISNRQQQQPFHSRVMKLGGSSMKTTMSASSPLLESSLSTSWSTNIAGSVKSFHATPLSLEKLNVEGLAQKVSLKGENVLVRVDLNVPLAKVGSGFRLVFDLPMFIFG